MVRRTCLAVICLLAVLLVVVFWPMQNSRLSPKFHSFQVLDRNGILLRDVLSKDHKTSIWAGLKNIAPELIAGTILREDKRFLAHNGIDILSLARALGTNLKAGEIVSGGSTITMQVAKIVLENRDRGFLSKVREMLYALKLEFYLSKAEILEIYLNCVPYGYLNYGIEAASNFYYDKPASQLSLGESCILAVIPKSPSVLNPYIKPDVLLVEKEQLIMELQKEGLADPHACQIAMNESLHVRDKNINFKAPHFVDFIISRAGTDPCSQITSTLDLNLQENIEKMLFTSISSLRQFNVNQGAVIVLDTRTGDVLVMAGSRDYFDAWEGQVNGTMAMRQPGSSIKPFLYILALGSGIPLSQVINDTMSEFRLADGTVFAPRNYGDRYHGQSRIREALASSFNIPTVSLLEKVSVPRFYEFLKRLHFRGLDEAAHHYGLALALGAAEVDLLELTNAYRAIANNGLWTEARYIAGEGMPVQGGERGRFGPENLFSREIAYMITHILSTNASRIKAFGMDSPLNVPFVCAAKTGTSKNFRDNWCIGYTKEYTVGVWVGNFDGSAMHGVSGISGAAPLFRDIMIELHRDYPPPDFEEPPTLEHRVICGRTGKIAGSNCPSTVEELFIAGTAPVETCSCQEQEGDLVRQCRADIKKGRKIQIVSPQDGDIYKIDPQIPLVNQRITFKMDVDTVISSVVVDLDGETVWKRAGVPYEFTWEPRPGIHQLRVKGTGKKEGHEETVSFRVY